jgi:hypothetical protein
MEGREAFITHVRDDPAADRTSGRTITLFNTQNVMETRLAKLY